MTKEELLQVLDGLSVETGSLACLGCGYEHNCGIQGCAILREAKELIEQERDAAIGDILRKCAMCGLFEAAAALTALMEENARFRAEIADKKDAMKELEQMKRERDAAVADLKAMVDKHGECVGCKFGNGKAGCGDMECDTHAHNHWKWRGPQKGDQP